MVSSLKQDEQEEMRQKILAYDIFSGNKPWGCSRRYEADYLEMDSNPGKEKYIQGMKNLFSKYGDSSILFSDEVNKINSKSKAQKRAIVVTESHIYKQDPKNYKIKPYETPLAGIQSISMSSHPDTFVVIHANEVRDSLLDLGVTGVEKVSEFVSAIVGQVKILTGNTIPVNFVDTVKYNNARTAKNPGVECTLTFRESNDNKGKGSTFKQGKNNKNEILYCE